jgi:uncharacterized protein (DUF1778 family)
LILANAIQVKDIHCVFLSYDEHFYTASKIFMPRHHTTIIDNSQTHAVNLRIRQDIRLLIDSAAKAQGKTRSDFMIDAARRAAEETLLDQALVRVDQATYEHFLEVLDQPANGEGFERLMSAPKPWDV